MLKGKLEKMDNIIKYSDFNDLFDYDVLIEGINIDKLNKVVHVDLSHENGIDTGILINPTYHKVDNYDVISIFKRKENADKTDGNPIIYALEGKNGWKINKEDIILLLKQFIKICGKIESKYDTILTIPSKSTLNKHFLYKLNNIIKCDNIIDELLISKVKASEILLSGNIDNSISYEDYIELEKIIQKMIESDNNFSFALLPKRLRKYILKPFELNPSLDILNYSEFINDKNILILDDTISSGNAISKFCDILLKTFQPKSVTIITLFSPI